MDMQVTVRIVSPEKEILNDETGLVVKGSDILNQMRINNMWKNDKQGKYASAMFDGQTFKFRIGEEVTLPLIVARHLRRMSAVCVGSDKLNGPLMPFLELGEMHDPMRPVPVKMESATTCPICHIEQDSFPALMRHQVKEHSDLFKEEVKAESKKKIAWDAPASTTTDQADDL